MGHSFRKNSKMVSKRNRAAPLAWKDMIFAAIADLKDRTGSSRVAIGRWILANFATSEDKVTLLLNRTLKREVEKGTLVQVKQSFKLSPDTKKALAKAAKKAAPAKKTTKPKKKAAPKKKKAAPKKKKAAPKKKKATKKSTKKGGKKR